MSNKNSTKRRPQVRQILTHGLFRLSIAGLLFLSAIAVVIGIFS